MKDLWEGLRESARTALSLRDYAKLSLAERLETSGVEAGELVSANRAELPWIPGVEIFARKVYPQRHRGYFGEFARRDEGTLARIGFWPAQWATATMFAGSAKGFHIHPPYLPKGEVPEKWFQRLFLEHPTNFALRPYAQEQWDVMFFVKGSMEMFLVDERAGLKRRVMRFLIEGDDQRGPNNVGVVIPAGVAHALRVESSGDLIMVYGTSTAFDPAFEGRIASDIESAPPPVDWAHHLWPA